MSVNNKLVEQIYEFRQIYLLKTVMEKFLIIDLHKVCLHIRNIYHMYRSKMINHLLLLLQQGKLNVRVSHSLNQTSVSAAFVLMERAFHVREVYLELMAQTWHGRLVAVTNSHQNKVVQMWLLMRIEFHQLQFKVMLYKITLYSNITGGKLCYNKFVSAKDLWNIYMNHA